MSTIHEALVQGSDEWLAARCGLITASEVKLIMTPTLKPASNDKQRAHIAELAAQRITRYVEPHYVSDDMLRGHEDEIEARALYAQHFAPVREVGFITRDFGDFTLGYSPDALVGDDGLIECKSRRQRFHVETIAAGEMPQEYELQVQSGMLISGRHWCDFISYSGGLPMVVIRVAADPEIQQAILDAAEAAEERIADLIRGYHAELARLRSVPTERKERGDIVL